MKVLIGTRKSKLALWQANQVKVLLESHGIRVEFVLFNTVGDQNQSQALSQIGGQALFTKALDEGLLQGKIDLAVHSSKDMPSTLHEGLEVISFLKREDPRDVLLSYRKEIDLENLSETFVIGTSSVRRQAFLHHYAPQAIPKLIRGNVDTRVKKMEAGEYDGILLAYAGVKRMGMTHLVVQKLNPMAFTPAVGQGAIAVVGRKGFELREKLRTALNHTATEIAVRCERAFLRVLQGGCHTPAFALATVIGETVSLHAGIAALDGSVIYRESRDGTADKAGILGTEVAEYIIKQEGGTILYA